MSLIDDLKEAERAALGENACPLCLRIQAEGDEETKEWLSRASAGTIGERKLATIFQRNKISDPESGYPIGRRTIVRHRAEEHNPA